MDFEIILDYCLVIIPILLSCVAIIISVSVSRKQNKIATFNIRYTCISQIHTILNFSQGVEGCNSPQIVLRLFDSLWGTNGTNLTFDDNLILYRSKLETIKKDINQAEFIFNKKYKAEPFEIIYALHEVVMAAINEKDLEEKVKTFIEKCNLFYEKDYKEMKKQTKI